MPLRVRCDASKPLEATAARFTGDENDPGIVRARQAGFSGHLGWKMVEPISFVDSRSHPAIQLADIITGTSVAALSRGTPPGLEETVERIHNRLLPDIILPDMEVIDLKQRGPAVNYLVLYNLAQRAEQGLSPHTGFAGLYRAAEVSWARGDFRAILRNAGARL